jgi:hypothetical protein
MNDRDLHFQDLQGCWSANPGARLETLHLGQPAIDVLKAKERVKDILAFNSLSYLRLRHLVGGFSGRFRRLGLHDLSGQPSRNKADHQSLQI